MIMPENIGTINERLLQTYGRFSTTDLPLWRVVWSEDQMEKRWITHTREGFELLEPEVQEVPKYRQYIQHKYVLERLVAVPENADNDLVNPISYEPVWVFRDKDDNPLPPIWKAIVVVIGSVYQAAAKATGARYKDPEVFDKKDAPEARKAKVDGLVRELFGNETDTGDALAHKEGIVCPQISSPQETERQ
jgi:hypothetical protein